MINGDVRHEGCHVANTRHDARNHGPTQGRAVQRSRLADDGTDSVCLDNAPDEERDTRNWHNDGLDSEEVTATCAMSLPARNNSVGCSHLMDWEPDCGEGDEPEEEEAHEVACSDSSRFRQMVGYNA